MNTEQILEDITILLRDVFDDPELAVTAQTSAKTVPGWDSMKQVMLLISVEDKFGIRLSSRETDRLKDVGDLVNAVAAHLPPG